MKETENKNEEFCLWFYHCVTMGNDWTFNLEKKTTKKTPHKQMSWEYFMVIQWLMQKPFKSHFRKETSRLGTKEDTRVYPQPKQQWKHTEPAESVDRKRGMTRKKHSRTTVQALPGYTTFTRSDFNSAITGKEILQFQLSCTQTRIPINSTHQKFSLFGQWNLFPLSIWIP